MDETTQQNAALVEEAAAAAATLADQSHRLSDAISVFRLRRSERGARGAIGPAPAF
jgi:methyl-accepting chemotaxis protein/aerotaxis receptor